MRNKIGIFSVSEEPGVQVVRRKIEFRLFTFLQGIDEQRFRTIFGINHAALREGGRDIAAGKGDLLAVRNYLNIIWARRIISIPRMKYENR